MFTLSEYVYSMLYLSSFPRKKFKLIVDIPYLIQISWGHFRALFFLYSCRRELTRSQPGPLPMNGPRTLARTQTQSLASLSVAGS